MPKLTEIRVAGFGGQGVILSAMVIVRAYSIYEGGFATLTQSFGTEARGGACVLSRRWRQGGWVHYSYFSVSQVFALSFTLQPARRRGIKCVWAACLLEVFLLLPWPHPEHFTGAATCWSHVTSGR